MSQKKEKIKRKILIIIILVIIVLSLLLVILMHLKHYSEENIKNRLISGIDNLNYSYTTTYTDNYVVGKKEKIVSINSGEITYVDYGLKKSNSVNDNTMYIENSTNNGISDMDYYKRYIEPYFNSSFKYKYKGKKIYNNISCLVVDFTEKGEISGKTTTTRFWINENLNIVEKGEYIINNNGKENVISTKEFDFHSGKNLDSDVTISQKALTEYSSDTNN